MRGLSLQGLTNIYLLINIWCCSCKHLHISFCCPEYAFSLCYQTVYMKKCSWRLFFFFFFFHVEKPETFHSFLVLDSEGSVLFDSLWTNTKLHKGVLSQDFSVSWDDRGMLYHFHLNHKTIGIKEVSQRIKYLYRVGA